MPKNRVLTPRASLSPEELTRLKKEWERIHSLPLKRHAVWLESLPRDEATLAAAFDDDPFMLECIEPCD